MFKRILLCFCLLSFGVWKLSAQQYSIFINLNEYYPLGNNNKAGYPIFWYSTDSKNALIGGFGLGFKMRDQLKDKVTLTGKGSVMRYRQYDEPLRLKDENGSALGILDGVITEYGVNLQGAVHYELVRNLDAGIGLGIISMLYSKTDFGKSVLDGEKLKVTNKYYHPVLLTLPIELTYHFDRIYLTSKSELGLLNRLRGGAAVREHAAIFSVEIGFLIGRMRAVE